MSIDKIRLSEKEKQNLISLKRKTGIKHWNILCRWALCASLAERSKPPIEEILSDSNIEMTFKTLTGENSSLYMALIRYRLEHDQYGHKKLSELDIIRLHINRGLSYINKKNNTLSSLLNTARTKA